MRQEHSRATFSYRRNTVFSVFIGSVRTFFIALAFAGLPQNPTAPPAVTPESQPQSTTEHGAKPGAKDDLATTLQSGATNTFHTIVAPSPINSYNRVEGVGRARLECGSQIIFGARLRPVLRRRLRLTLRRDGRRSRRILGQPCKRESDEKGPDRADKHRENCIPPVTEGCARVFLPHWSGTSIWPSRLNSQPRSTVPSIIERSE